MENIKTIHDLKAWVENADPLTAWHEDMFHLWVKLHGVKIEAVDAGILCTDASGGFVII